MDELDMAKPGDPTEVDLHLTARELQAVLTGLLELPAKVSHDTLNSIRLQLREAIRTAREHNGGAHANPDRPPGRKRGIRSDPDTAPSS